MAYHTEGLGEGRSLRLAAVVIHEKADPCEHESNNDGCCIGWPDEGNSTECGKRDAEKSQRHCPIQVDLGSVRRHDAW